MKHLALAALLLSAHVGAEQVSIPVTIDGVQRTVLVDAQGVWLATRIPDAVFIPNDPSGTVQHRDQITGTTWTVVANGSIYRDGQPFTTAKVKVLTLIGNTVYGKSAATSQWSRWEPTYNNGAGKPLGAWLLATSTPTTMLEPPAPPAASTAARKGPLLASFKH
jgi:hypothetical protein